MPAVPIYLRWEHTMPPHYKFYEVEVELSLFFPKKLVRRWGRIGTRRPRSLYMEAGDPDELARRVAQIRRRRLQHGYQQVSEIGGPVVEVRAA